MKNKNHYLIQDYKRVTSQNINNQLKNIYTRLTKITKNDLLVSFCFLNKSYIYNVYKLGKY